MSGPLLVLLAGPNGAGKSTLYESRIRHLTDAEFVNADRLAAAQFGHPAATEAEGRWGQEAAERRRDALLAEGRSLVAESTFSHPSKLALLGEARRRGYTILVFHVSVETAEDAVARVAHRVGQGGHPVPEDRIRGRYARNGPLIREAVLDADHGYVLDNSRLGEPPRLVLEFRSRRLVGRWEPVPGWVGRLYLSQ